MCVLAWVWAIHPQYPLLVLANRDEDHRRPTLPLHWWPDHPELLAGRDLDALGTWLGVTRTGRFAAISNRAGYTPRDAPSRGQLVSGVLLSGEAAEAIMQRTDCVGSRYAGFNLIVYDGESLCYCSNRQASHALPPGVYGMANREFHDHSPRVHQLEIALKDWAHSGESEPRWVAWATLLMDTSPSDGKRSRSSLFVIGSHYGTRASQLLAFDRFGKVTVIERRFDATARQVGEREMSFCSE